MLKVLKVFKVKIILYSIIPLTKQDPSPSEGQTSTSVTVCRSFLNVITFIMSFEAASAQAQCCVWLWGWLSGQITNSVSWPQVSGLENARGLTPRHICMMTTSNKVYMCCLWGACLKPGQVARCGKVLWLNSPYHWLSTHSTLMVQCNHSSGPHRP